MTSRTLMQINSHLIVLIFLAAIFIPFSIAVIEKDKNFSKIEKRELVKFPGMPTALWELREFPKLFDSYYSDHFGLRDWFSQQYKVLKYQLGDTPSEDVTIGKNGWLFLGSIKKGYKKYNDPIGDARNVNLYSELELQVFVQYLSNLKQKLDKQGIQYVLVISPNKHTIYFDQLPDVVLKNNSFSATDQLVNAVKELTDVTVVDLRAKLIASKDQYQLYYKTDTHWNHFAANIAQFEIMTEIEKLFPSQIQPELLQLNKATKKGGDLANFVGVDIYKKYEDINPQPIFEKACIPVRYPIDGHKRATHTFSCEGQKLNAVIYRDSFFTALKPYFSRKFKRSTYIWKKMDLASLTKYIALENPNIIIEEWVERSLPYLPKDYLDKL